MKDIKVIIVDDHPLFRQGVADALSIEQDITISHHASDGEDGLNAIRKLKPDVAVIDVNLPSMNGHQIVWHLQADKIPTRVVLLTAYDDAEQRIHAIQSGAAAFCSKDVQADHLVDVIRTVHEGRYVIGNQIFELAEIEEWLEKYTRSQTQASDNAGKFYQPLTAREMEVLLEVTHGFSNKEIALRLGISPQTVKNHVTSIFRKLNVEDRTQAAVYALRQGWVRLYRNNSHNQE